MNVHRLMCIVVVSTFCDDFSVSLSSQQCSSLLGGVESIQIAVSYSHTFCKPLSMIGEIVIRNNSRAS